MVNEYNNKYHSTIKRKSVGIKSSTYIDFGKGNNKKNPKFKVCIDVRTLKYRKVFAEDYFPSLSE